MTIEGRKKKRFFGKKGTNIISKESVFKKKWGGWAAGVFGV